MWMRFKWIPEENQKIDLVADNFGTDLLIATQRTALELVDLEVQFLFERLAGGASRIQLVMCQQIAVELAPLQDLGAIRDATPVESEVNTIDPTDRN